MIFRGPATCLRTALIIILYLHLTFNIHLCIQLFELISKDVQLVIDNVLLQRSLRKYILLLLKRLLNGEACFISVSLSRSICF